MQYLRKIYGRCIRCVGGLLMGGMLLTSCATASLSRYGAVGRVKEYEWCDPQVPEPFDGFRIAFATDFHYESRFGKKRLEGLVRTLQGTAADVLLLGGDYRGRHGGDVGELFRALQQVQTECGTFAVMGNHERGMADTLARRAMAATGVRLLEHRVDTLRRDTAFILLAGVRNPFDLQRNGISPTLALRDEDFVVLLTHTPDYVEDVPITHTDIALAGHTHGGQVSLFRRWSLARFSHYGNRFLTGLKYNSQGIPVIVSNGIGTSRRDVRLFTPSEVVVLKLVRKR